MQLVLDAVENVVHRLSLRLQVRKDKVCFASFVELLQLRSDLSDLRLEVAGH